MVDLFNFYCFLFPIPPRLTHPINLDGFKEMNRKTIGCHVAEGILQLDFCDCQGVKKSVKLGMEDCVFCQIAKDKQGEVVVFPSIDPKANLHLIIIPKVHVENLDELSDDLLLKIFKEATKIVKEKNLAKMGYRIVTNGGAAKAVSHLHFHLLGNVEAEREI